LRAQRLKVGGRGTHALGVHSMLDRRGHHVHGRRSGASPGGEPADEVDRS
jgi:hypothetical protein